MLTAEFLSSVYAGSDGEATKALYAELSTFGPAGLVAVNLFRAHKTSGRAKVYRGGIRSRGSYRGMAYDRKQWSIENLCSILTERSTELGISWGWSVDPDQPRHCHVLYVDLPTGQVSFHAGSRGDGPEYDGVWDGVRDVGSIRIIRWIVSLGGAPIPPEPPSRVTTEQFSLAI